MIDSSDQALKNAHGKSSRANNLNDKLSASKVTRKRLPDNKDKNDELSTASLC